MTKYGIADTKRQWLFHLFVKNKCHWRLAQDETSCLFSFLFQYVAGQNSSRNISKNYSRTLLQATATGVVLKPVQPTSKKFIPMHHFIADMKTFKNISTKSGNKP